MRSRNDLPSRRSQWRIATGRPRVFPSFTRSVMGFRVLREILWVYKDAKPLVFFTAMSVLVFALALAIGLPVVFEFIAHRAGCLRFPRAILACGLAVISSLLLICGFILDTIV